MFMVLAFRPTHALLINGYEHTGEICCNCMDVMDRKKTTLFDSQLLAEAFNKKN